MIINLVLFFIPKRQEIYRLYLIKKRKKLACMRLNSKTYIDSTNADSFSFKISDISKTTYVSIIMYGSTSAKNMFLYNIFIDIEANGREVTFIKIIDRLTSRTFSGSYNDSTNTLLITSNSTIWAGIRLIVIK